MQLIKIFSLLLRAFAGQKDAIFICFLIVLFVVYIIIRRIVAVAGRRKEDLSTGKSDAPEQAMSSEPTDLAGVSKNGEDASPSSIDFDYLIKKKQKKWAIETWNRWIGSPQSHPWYFRKNPMTSREQGEYWTLLSAAKEFSLFVFPKVGLIDLLEPRDERYIRYIWSKHVDFTLWSPNTQKVVCIFELLDGTHTGWRADYRDAFVREVLKEAGYLYFELDYFENGKLRDLIKYALLNYNETQSISKHN